MIKDSMRAAASRIIRFATREAYEELERIAPHRRHAERIDVPDMLRQLGSPESRQLLHRYFAWNHRWVAMLEERNRRVAVETYDFIDEVLPDAMFYINQFAVIRSRREDMIELDGHILDFGVHRGDSTRALAAIYPEREIHGFDSFEGLPEDWTNMPKGSFGDVRGALPEVPANVTLHKGWFDDTLPAWAAHHMDRPVSILRVDCDLYSSTKTIFDTLEPIIVPGTWIVFDELIGYRGWREHEYKALIEFLERSGLDVAYIAHGLTYVITRVVTAD